MYIHSVHAVQFTSLYIFPTHSFVKMLQTEMMVAASECSVAVSQPY